MDVMLSDNMRRYLCRTGFLLLCLLPTVVCMKWILFPPSTTEWSGRLQQQLGVVNTVQHVTTPTPQMTKFDQLHLGVDRFPSRLELHQATLQNLNEGRQIHVTKVEGSVQAFWDTLDRISETICWTIQSDRAFQLRFDELKLLQNESEDSPITTWQDVKIVISNRGKLFSLSFLTDDKTKAFDAQRNPIVRIERRTDKEGSTWNVDATGFKLPTWTIDRVITSCASANADSEIANAVANLRKTSSGWQGAFKGHLLNLDLQQTVAYQFGGVLTGTASANIENAVVRDGKIERLNGHLHCPQGIIGRHLLQRCQTYFGMQLVEEFDQPEEAFSNLRLQFAVQRDLLSVNSMTADGVVMDDEEQVPMLINKQGQWFPVTTLLHFLAGPEQRFYANTSALARHLTLPAIEIDPQLSIQRTAEQQDVGDGSFLNR